ncbi:histidine-type phosphatase [Sphingomonas ginsenosidimutans]|uniref:histidine-type phosphatase n=2 Tax=Sphingomonas ginsenosidimutans TaxID=862134 RepID=UPI001C3E9F2B|nr:histidine-type phosphatase [Sphingomonas ginsenosidimutans]
MSHRIRAIALTACIATLPAAPAMSRPAPAVAPPPVMRIVLLMRHGVRAPLRGEVPDGTRTGAPWPVWNVPDSQITPHGAAALRALGRADRRWFARAGILPATGCPADGVVRLWANTSSRTIASGEAYAAGLAPGCPLPVGHRSAPGADPLFEPLNTRPAGFDAAAAALSVQSYTGGVDALAMRHRASLALLDHILGCPAPGPCSPVAPSTVAPSGDRHDIAVTGPIRAASGTAQVLMLQYLEGMPMARVGWGRATPQMLERIGAVHGALFDLYARPPYMTAFQTAPTVARIAADFTRPDAPRVDMLVGHDTNVAALAAVLGVTVKAPGFAAGDPSPGGALAVALVRDAHGLPAVRLWYRSQSAAAIRAAADRVTWTALPLAGCDDGPAHVCPLPRFLARLRAGTVVADGLQGETGSADPPRLGVAPVGERG